MQNTPPRVGGALRETDDEKVLLGSVPDTPVTTMTRAEFVARLLDLGRRCGEVAIYVSLEWDALDPIDPRRFAAVVVAAECWRREGEPDAIEARLRHELAEADWLAAWRLRRLSGDLSEAEDWSAIAAWTPIAELRRLRLYGTEAA